MTGDLIIFAGTANPPLGRSIAAHLGVPLGDATVERFSDGEVSVRLGQSVRRKDVFVVQPTAPPVDANLVELLCWADVCRRASVASFTAVVPYFGYARSDKRHGRREPIAASMVAQVMQSAGVDHVITLDLHAAQIEGFFQVPVDSLTAVQVLCSAVREELPRDAVVVSPDMGRFRTATDYAQRLGLPVAVLHKRRESGTETEVTRLVGDVAGRACLIIDDMISTGGTLAASIEALLQAGARPELLIAATHGLFVKDAKRKLSHPAVRRVLVTNSIPQKADDWPQLRVVPVAELIGSAIERVMTAGSLSSLF